MFSFVIGAIQIYDDDDDDDTDTQDHTDSCCLATSMCAVAISRPSVNNCHNVSQYNRLRERGRPPARTTLVRIMTRF